MRTARLGWCLAWCGLAACAGPRGPAYAPVGEGPRTPRRPPEPAPPPVVAAAGAPRTEPVLPGAAPAPPEPATPRLVVVEALDPRRRSPREPVAGIPTGPVPRLVLVEARRNQILDTEAWLQRHGLALPELRVAPGAGGDGDVPLQLAGVPLTRILGHGDHRISLYGDGMTDQLLRVERAGPEGREVFAFDLRPWAFAPGSRDEERTFVEQGVSWAQLEGEVLYVSHGHRTYARSSRGENAWITALDVRSGAVLWRSEPLVANARNFVLHGGVLLAGYGFTAEPDYVFVLSKADGSRLARTKVRSGPELLFVRDGHLLVRTYDHDYVFRLN